MATTTRRVDVAVVGAGVNGLASAWALRRAGHDVLVLEQFANGHTRGSSHAASRIFRFAYDETEWVTLAQEALPLWREAEAESGLQLLNITGLLDARRDSTPLRAALDACGAEYELLTPAAAAERFGILVEGEAVLETHGGIAFAGRAREAFSRGVTVEYERPVTAIEPHDEGVRLSTPAGDVEARVAVIAAGAWATPLLAQVGIALETWISRETVSYYPLPGVLDLPSVIDWNEHTGRHAYSLATDEELLKVGLHHSGQPADPDVPGDPDPEVVAAEAEWVARRFPAADPRPVRAEACLYTNIADDAFVLERHGAVVVCSACSGHGFKFAPAVGTRVAALCGDAA
jgi:sarcosine oxidase